MEITKEFIQEEYVDKQRSFQDIATELNTYPNAVRRKAIKFGFKPRDKSEAQSSALKSGRHRHPTKDTKRSAAVKEAISEGVSKSWDNLSDEAYNARVQQGKDQWESMTPEQIHYIQKKAIAAIRRTSTEGSKLEKFLAEYLKKAGFMIEFHKDNLLPNEKLEIDIFLPSKSIAIEVDGPSHFKDIWGNGSHLKAQKADSEKNGLLLNFKINVIRIKQIRRNLSDKNMRDTAKAVHDKINLIVSNNVKASVYEIEVN